MSVKKDFGEGNQPCDNFKPEDDVFLGLGNEHECPGCLLTRSFCLNCNKDHHYKGWDLHNKIIKEYDIRYKLEQEDSIELKHQEKNFEILREDKQ